MISLTLVGDREVVASLRELPSKLRAELLKTISKLAANLRSLVQNRYLSGPTGEHTLNRISGALTRSVTADWTSDSDSVSGRVFYTGDVPYAAIHEFGGIIHIPEIVPVQAKALHFFAQGQEVFAMRTRAHDVVMPERAPLRTAFAAYLGTIESELDEAVARVARAG